MPKHQIIKVARGDFDKKYIRVEHDGARNRVLNERKLRGIAKNWGDASKDTVTLVREGEEFLIADGQHRIASASTYFKNPVTLHAMVWERDEVENLGDFITAFNQGTPFSSADLMNVYQEQSPWPGILTEEGVSADYKRWRASKFSYPGIMRGLSFADDWRDAGKFKMSMRHKQDLLRPYWVDYPEDGVREAAKALKWWQPTADTAFRSYHRNSVLFSDMAIAVAITMYRLNHRSPKKLAQLGERLLASGVIPQLKVVGTKHSRLFVREMLVGFNYRASKDLVNLYGETGRD